jgi:hypothetical protein
MAPSNYPSYVLAVITNATKSTFIRHIPRRRPKQQWCVPLIPTLDNNNNTMSPNLYPIADVTDPQDGYPTDQLQPNSNSPRCGMLWANSQTAPLRCLQIRGTLLLSLGGQYACCGFVSNANVLMWKRDISKWDPNNNTVFVIVTSISS